MADLLALLLKTDPALANKIVFPLARPADLLTHDEYVAEKHAQADEERTKGD